MPRLVKTSPKYRKHKASGQAVVTIAGRDYYLGAYGSKASELEYRRLLAEYFSVGRSNSFGAAKSDLTVVELAADYLRFARGYYGVGPTSEFNHITGIVRPLRELYGRTPAVEFGPRELKAVRQTFITRGWSRNYINTSLRRIIRMFRWGAAEGMISPDVPQALAMVSGLRKGKSDARETAPVPPVSNDVVDATLPHLPEIVADMVHIQRLTGARPNEVCILRPCDVDQSQDIWEYRPHSHKTQYRGRDRVILIGPKAQCVLLRYLARSHDDFCFRPADSEAKRRAVAHSTRVTPLSCGNAPGSNRVRKPKRSPGKQYTSGSYGRSIARACEKAFPHPTLSPIPRGELTAEQLADLKAWQKQHRWAPNQLRHAAATEIRRQFGLEAAQVILGHSQANVTQVYAERDMARGIEVARAIG